MQSKLLKISSDFMKIKSYFYSIFFIGGILILLMLGIFFVTTGIISEHIEKQIAAKINQFQSYVESNKDQAIENLINYCKYTANSQSLKSAVEYHDPEAIYSILEDSNNIIFGDISLVTDNNGNILTKSENLNGINNNIELPGISYLIDRRNPFDHDKKIDFWNVKQEYYLVCTVPVENNNNIIGTLSIGFLINTLFDQSIPDNTNFALLHNNEVLFSQFSFDDKSITEFVNVHRPIVDAILTTSLPSDLFLTKIENNEVYSKLVPFGYKIPAYFILLVSKSNEFYILDSLIKYFIYIFIFCSLLLIVIFFVIGNRYSKRVENLSLTIQELKKKDDKTDYKTPGDLRENESKTAEMVKELKGTVLFSKIISLNEQKNAEEISSISPIINYIKIQKELIELYDGKIENEINNQIVASFTGEDSIEKSLQCSLSIMKLINKENDSAEFQIGISINSGSIFYSSDQKSNLFGSTVELAEAINNIVKSGQILINKECFKDSEIKYLHGETRMWKFKNLKNKVKIVNVLGERT